MRIYVANLLHFICDQHIDHSTNGGHCVGMVLFEKSWPFWCSLYSESNSSGVSDGKPHKTSKKNKFSIWRIHSLPWDQRRPLGYFGEFALSSAVAQTYVLANGSYILLFISICRHHQAFSKMFKHFAQSLIHSEKHPNDERILRDLIEFHISVNICMLMKWVIFFIQFVTKFQGKFKCPR